MKDHIETTADVLRRFYAEVWEQENLSAIPDYFHHRVPDDILIADRAVEVDEVREWMDVLRALVTDIKVTFLHTIDQGDWTAAFMRINCRSRANGAPVEVYQQIMSRQADGRLIESYPQFDLLRFFEQLGQLPEDVYPLLMGGTRLT